MYRQIIGLAILLVFSQFADGQEKKDGPYPAAVFVQLRSEHNRIEALTAAKMYTELKEVIYDANMVTKTLKADFHDNFHYCPVYYFVDTNLDLIKQKKFAGIFFTEDGSPITDSSINAIGKNYFIAYYGHPVSQAKSQPVQGDTARYKYDPDPPFGKALVILNSDFLQLTYFYRLGYQSIFMGKKNKNKKYFYSSIHFDIEYFATAATFEREMQTRYGKKIPVKPGRR